MALLAHRLNHKICTFRLSDECSAAHCCVGVDSAFERQLRVAHGSGQRATVAFGRPKWKYQSQARLARPRLFSQQDCHRVIRRLDSTVSRIGLARISLRLVVMSR